MNKVDNRVCGTFKKGDIVLCRLGEGIGSEQQGTRPAIIIQNNIGNKYSPTVIVAMITSSYSKARLETQVEINSEECKLHKDSVIMCEQLRTVSKTRIEGVLGRASKYTLEKVNQALRISLDIGGYTSQAVTMAEVIRYFEKFIINYKNSNESNKEALDSFMNIYCEHLLELERFCKRKFIKIEEIYEVSSEMSSLINRNKMFIVS